MKFTKNTGKLSAKNRIPACSDPRVRGTQMRVTSPSGIVMAMESPAALNDDFNLSTAESTTVLELAEKMGELDKADAAAFKAKDAAGAKKAFDAANKACNDCHKKFRDKE